MYLARLFVKSLVNMMDIQKYHMQKYVIVSYDQISNIEIKVLEKCIKIFDEEVKREISL